MDEIIEQVESLIARANIGVIVTMNGTDHHLINQLNRIKEALTKQKWQQHGVMQAEWSEGADGAAVGQRSVGTNAEARDCETCKHLESENPYPCGKCDENYSMWEAPSGGHL